MRAVEVVKRARGERLEVLIQLCHRVLDGTRGVAMTLARVDFRGRHADWTGVGNVTADLVAKAADRCPHPIQCPPGRRGHRRLPDPGNQPAQVVSIRPGDLLVIASDGIAEDHLDHIDFAASAVTIAERTAGQARQGNRRRHGARRTSPGSIDMTGNRRLSRPVRHRAATLPGRARRGQPGRRPRARTPGAAGTISMLDIVEHHVRLVHELADNLSVDRAGRTGIPAADAGPARRRDSRIPRRHQALRGDNGPAPRASPIATNSAPPW